jgi:rhomboid protease GluP
MEKFALLETQAIEGIQFSHEPSDDSALVAIRERGIKKWQEAIVLLDESDKLQLPDVFHKRNQLFKKYCEIRIRSYEHLCKVVEGKADINSFEIQMINNQLIQIVNEIKSTTEK